MILCVTCQLTKRGRNVLLYLPALGEGKCKGECAGEYVQGKCPVPRVSAQLDTAHLVSVQIAIVIANYDYLLHTSSI